MGKITKIKTANRDEWRELRGHYIGGSDAAAVVGLNRHSSPYSLWAEKTGRVPGVGGNLATEVGTYLEEFVAQKFSAVSGKKVRRVNQSFVNSDFPWAIANIDRDVVGEDSGLECKSTSALNTRKFRNGEYPENYYCQSVHYLAVTGKRRWYVAVLIGNFDFKIYQMTRIQDDACPKWCESSLYIEDAEIAALMAAERDFWQLVQNDIPPALDGSAATTEAIKTIYKESGENVVDLFPLAARLDQYTALSQQIKELEALRDEAANYVKAYMGDAWGGECGRYKVTWKISTRRTFDSKRFERENPELDLSGYYKETSTRAFRVIEQKEA